MGNAATLQQPEISGKKRFSTKRINVKQLERAIKINEANRALLADVYSSYSGDKLVLSGSQMKTQSSDVSNSRSGIPIIDFYKLQPKETIDTPNSIEEDVSGTQNHMNSSSRIINDLKIKDSAKKASPTENIVSLKDFLKQSLKFEEEEKQHLFPKDKFKRKGRLLSAFDEENGILESCKFLEYQYRSNSRERGGLANSTELGKSGAEATYIGNPAKSLQLPIRKVAKSVDCIHSNISKYTSLASNNFVDMDLRIRKIDEILKKSKDKMNEINQDIKERKVFRQIAENLSKINVCYLNTQNHHRTTTPLSPRKTVSRKTSFIGSDSVVVGTSSRSDISHITPRAYQNDQESFILKEEDFEGKMILDDLKKSSEDKSFSAGTLRGRRLSHDKRSNEFDQSNSEVIVEMKVSLHPKMKDKLKKVKNKKESLKRLTPFKSALIAGQEEKKREIKEFKSEAKENLLTPIKKREERPILAVWDDFQNLKSQSQIGMTDSLTLSASKAKMRSNSNSKEAGNNQKKNRDQSRKRVIINSESQKPIGSSALPPKFTPNVRKF